MKVRTVPVGHSESEQHGWAGGPRVHPNSPVANTAFTVRSASHLQTGDPRVVSHNFTYETPPRLFHNEEVHVRAQASVLDRTAHCTSLTTHLEAHGLMCAQGSVLDRTAPCTSLTTHLGAHGLAHHGTGPSDLNTQALKF